MSTGFSGASGFLDKNSFLKMLLEQKGGTVVGETYCGVYRDMPYTITFANGNAARISFVVTVGFDVRVKKSVIKKMSAPLMDIMKAKDAGTIGNTLKVSFTQAGTDNLSGNIDRVLDTILSCTRDEGYIIAGNCRLCRNAAADSYALIGNEYVPVHGGCVAQKTNDEINKANINQIEGNYILGFIGAVLGGIVGMIPTVLLIVFAGVISAWLCALIPLCAYFGYKILKGKMNNAATAATIIVSAILVPVMDYVISVVEVYREFVDYAGMQYILSPGEYISFFMEDPAAFAPTLLQELLFVGIGVLLVFSMVRRGNKHVYADAEAMRASLRPMGYNQVSGEVPAAESTASEYPAAYPTVYPAAETAVEHNEPAE